MEVITKQKEGYQYQMFIDRDYRTLLEFMRQSEAQAKKAKLEVLNPWDCHPKYALTVETIEI